MVEWLEFEKASSVIECGPGTGVFTQTILAKLSPHSKFFMIEVNPTFVRILRERFPDQKIYQESVFNVRHLCEQQGIREVDCVISGLPWASFSP
ncbi:MAG: class I SAM-dependent methyltransferase, partial [Gammaproteobacteria bacterium]